MLIQRRNVLTFVIALFLIMGIGNGIVKVTVFADAPISSYSITPQNAFSSSFKVSIQGISNALYFNIYKISIGTFVNGTPVAVTNPINSMPTVFSNIADLKIYVYSDANGENIVAEFTLNSSNQLVLIVKPTGVIEGYVKMQSKAAGKNAGIKITDEVSHLETITNEAGYFKLEGITPGKLTLAITKDNYLKRTIKDISVTANQISTISSISNYIPLWAGDLDGSDGIGINDLNILINTYGKIIGDGSYNVNADFDEKDGVGPNDLNILISNFGMTSNLYPDWK